MQKIAITFLLTLFFSASEAQQISNQTTGSFGSSRSNGSTFLEDHIGSMAVTTISTASFMYTQGFIQPDAGTTSVVPPIQDVVLSSGSGLDNAGSTLVNGSIVLEFTVGEAASKTLGDASHLVTQGILQPYSPGSTLPVTGLSFFAKRISATQVQLDWKTIQEINNKGFRIERRKEYESSFADAGFVPAKGLNGNSSLPLEYRHLDYNNFTGSTYYRLRQEDLDGRFSYSVLRLVKGDTGQSIQLQVWPVPAVGYFNVSVNGISQPEQLQIMDMNGRLVKTMLISNQGQVQVSGLPAGTYIIQLGKDKNLLQKLILQ